MVEDVLLNDGVKTMGQEYTAYRHDTPHRYFLHKPAWVTGDVREKDQCHASQATDYNLSC